MNRQHLSGASNCWSFANALLRTRWCKRNIASFTNQYFKAFENAKARYRDGWVSCECCFNSLLPAASASSVDFKNGRYWSFVAKVRCFSKIAPNTDKYRLEDVHRAGGIMWLLGELDRAGLIHKNTHTVFWISMGEQLDQYDIIRNQDEELHKFFRCVALFQYPYDSSILTRLRRCG